MASILLHGPASVTGQAALRRIAGRVRGDGHETIVASGDVLQAARDADALLVLLDGDDGAIATLAVGAALGKPVLALVGPNAPRPLRADRVTYQAGVDESEWLVALDDWYGEVSPFAGRMVRDLIPQLVREAGHDVRFRAVGPDEKPRFLKEKVLHEAQELLGASAGQEKEEIGDLLEALEALIRTRDYDRESLKRIKDNKRKQRGGFERGWVVEATSGADERTIERDDDLEKEGSAEEPESRIFEV